MTAVHLVLCLVLAFSMVVGLVLPGWPRPIRRATDVCVALLALAGLAFASALAFAALDTWPGVPISATICLAAVFFAFWFAASPEEGGDEDEEGGGGGPRKGDPEKPTPQSPSGPAVDWTDFDLERESWAPRPDRELVPTSS